MSSVFTARLTAALQEIKRTTNARHRLPRTSPAYQAALQEEVRLTAEIRRLIEADRAERRPD